MSLAKQAERTILKGSTLKGKVTPHYQGLSLPNVVQSVQEGFGVKAASPLSEECFDPKLVKNKTVVLFCLDGFGWEYLKKSKVLRKLPGFPITSVAPSTTVTCLSSLASGLTPQEHGILGFRMYLRELGHVTSMLRFGPSQGIGSFADEGIDPEIFFPKKTAFQRLRRAGVESQVLNKMEYVDSPLSQMIFRGTDQVPYVTLSDLLLKTEQAISKRGKRFVYAYWDSIDSVSHLYGPGTTEVKREIKQFDNQLAQFLDGLKAKQTTLLFTADHGFIDVPKKRVVDLGKQHSLVPMLDPPPGGEGRMRYLYCRRGKKDKVRDFIETKFSKKAELLTADEAISHGLFGAGNAHEETLNRIGDFVLLPRKRYAFTYPFLDKREPLGWHGGLTREEMLVPLLWKEY